MKSMKETSKFISAGAFDDYGGWVLDTQFIANTGSSYLLAHGLGIKAKNATAKIHIGRPGRYNVWAYTKDWVAHWKQGVAPGLFEIGIDGWRSDVLGNEGKEWHWQLAGACDIEKTEKSEAELSLIDLTGFEGRCAAIFLSADLDFVPQNGKLEFEKLRKTLCGGVPEMAGQYDIAIAGGGIAGMAAAVSAARGGLKVALIQDRFVLGGNNSSEVRVWLGGETNFEPFPKIGDITRSFEPAKCAHYGHTNTAELYEDEKRLEMIRSIPNIDLYLGHYVKEANMETEGDTIKSIVCADVRTFAEITIGADLFVDATGDATLGHAAGAHYEITTNGHMGMTNVWHVKDTGEQTSFPRCPWAIDLSRSDFPGRYAESDEKAELSLGGWYWEGGMEHDPIEKAEYARDTNFRAMYGAVDALKNVDGVLGTYGLAYASYIGGKRESRRLLGDIILTKGDVYAKREFEDGCVPSTWSFDVHYPKREYYASFHEGDAFITSAYFEDFPVNPYFVPYRCLYSRNISNLFMAGRNASVSHDALGTVRVMRTCGMMGEVVGYAAALCKKHGTTPRGVYENHLGEFVELLKGSIG